MDQAEQLKALTAAVESLLQLQSQKEGAAITPSTPSESLTPEIDLYNKISARVEKYIYGFGDDTKPFSKWLLRYEHSIVTEAAPLPPAMQTRLVLDKLGQAEFDKLVDHVAPKDPSKMPQKELLDVLKELFCVPSIRRLIKILNYKYDDLIPLTQHMDRINRNAVKFDQVHLSNNNLRTLLLIQLFSRTYEHRHLKNLALTVLDENPNATMENVAARLKQKNITLR